MADKIIGLFLIGWLSECGSFIDWLTLRSSDSDLKPVNGTGFKVSWHSLLTMAEEQLVMTYKRRGTFHSQVKRPSCWIYICIHTHTHAYIHEINPLHKISSVQCSIVNYKHSIVQQISRVFFFFLILDDWNFIPIEQQLPISLSPLTLAATLLLCVSMSLITLDNSYKWNHAVSVLQRLTFQLA